MNAAGGSHAGLARVVATGRSAPVMATARRGPACACYVRNIEAAALNVAADPNIRAMT